LSPLLNLVIVYSKRISVTKASLSPVNAQDAQASSNKCHKSATPVA